MTNSVRFEDDSFRKLATLSDSLAFRLAQTKKMIIATLRPNETARRDPKSR